MNKKTSPESHRQLELLSKLNRQHHTQTKGRGGGRRQENGRGGRKEQKGRTKNGKQKMETKTSKETCKQLSFFFVCSLQNRQKQGGKEYEEKRIGDRRKRGGKWGKGGGDGRVETSQESRRQLEHMDCGRP